MKFVARSGSVVVTPHWKILPFKLLGNATLAAMQLNTATLSTKQRSDAINHHYKCVYAATLTQLLRGDD